MRIIAGRFKGARIPSPRGKGVRPTTDRVREALFSALGTAVEGANVLELFAGTGAFGLEALSRGAGYVVFVERDRKTAEALSRIVRSFGVEDSVSILNMDAERALSVLADRDRAFGIVFMDPPYGSDLVSSVVSSDVFPSLLETDGLLIVEREAKESEVELPSAFTKRFSRKYGGTVLEIFHGFHSKFSC
jgi:16S rRNA (guanine966-N2)-methyltransferase